MAALEAMACEVPVVASRVGGLPEVIDDGETGFLCEPDDLDGMAESRHRRASRPDAARAHRCGGRPVGPDQVLRRGDRTDVRGVLPRRARREPRAGVDESRGAINRA